MVLSIRAAKKFNLFFMYNQVKEVTSINLILLTEEKRQKYCVISNMSRLLSIVSNKLKSNEFCTTTLCIASWNNVVCPETFHVVALHCTVNKNPKCSPRKRRYTYCLPVSLIILPTFESFIVHIQSCSVGMDTASIESTCAGSLFSVSAETISLQLQISDINMTYRNNNVISVL